MGRTRGFGEVCGLLLLISQAGPSSSSSYQVGEVQVGDEGGPRTGRPGVVIMNLIIRSFVVFMHSP